MRRFSLPLVFVLVVGVPALAASPADAAGPDSNLAANVNGGGCYPQPVTGDLFTMLELVNPEWAPVLNGQTVDSVPHLMHGTALDVHGRLGGDFPATHISSDMVAELALDPSDTDFIATGNGPNLSLEWEALAVPPYVWPGQGDKVVALGRWIFDCGHPDAVPGTCSTTTSQTCLTNDDCAPAGGDTSGCPTCVAGETCAGVNYRYSSEIHAPHAMASIRQGRGFNFSKNGGRPSIPVTRADIYVNAFAGGAGDRCIITHQSSFLDLLSVQCYPLADPVAQINAQDFTFDVPLPPKPAAGSALRKRVIKYPKSLDGRRARLSIKKFLDDPQPHLTVTVQLGAPGHATEFAGTILAGWARDTTPMTHVRVTLQSVKINNPVRPSTLVSPKTCSTANTPCNTKTDCPMGEFCFGVGPVKGWYVDYAVNADWQRTANLDDIDAGDEIVQTLVSDQYLSATDSVHIISRGKSQECVDTMYGKSLHQDLLEQGLSKGATCLLSTTREAGTTDTAYPAPDFGAGVGGSMDYQVNAVGGVGGNCSVTATTQCVGNVDCPMGETCVHADGSYTLNYRIERIP